ATRSATCARTTSAVSTPCSPRTVSPATARPARPTPRPWRRPWRRPPRTTRTSAHCSPPCAARAGTDAPANPAFPTAIRWFSAVRPDRPCPYRFSVRHMFRLLLALALVAFVLVTGAIVALETRRAQIIGFVVENAVRDGVTAVVLRVSDGDGERTWSAG